MPWNCLCSSKDKRRPEISAPILKVSFVFQNKNISPVHQYFRTVDPLTKNNYIFQVKILFDRGIR